jgi:hypothetical protein
VQPPRVTFKRGVGLWTSSPMAYIANPSTLASVFLIKSDVKNWSKLHDDDALLSQLQAEFWRKSMAEEVEEKQISG